MLDEIEQGVPAPFEEPFLRAQEYVARYFANRVENPDTATIAIAGERYVLLRAASLSLLRARVEGGRSDSLSARAGFPA